VWIARSLLLAERFEARPGTDVVKIIIVLKSLLLTCYNYFYVTKCMMVAIRVACICILCLGTAAELSSQRLALRVACICILCLGTAAELSSQRLALRVSCICILCLGTAAGTVITATGSRWPSVRCTINYVSSWCHG